MMNPDLLKQRVYWATPWPGRTAMGEECTSHVESSMSVPDAIRTERAAMYERNPERASIMTDQELLDNFIVIHWAEVR